ncbi:MAG: hypothetical protein ACXVRH_10825 [Thermoleophilaceae bacterium]
MKAAGSTRPAFARALLECLERWASDRDWKGTDQYEGLNATRLVKPLMRSSSGRRAVIQAVKRSPVNPRPLLGIAPQHNAAALAWFASAYARNATLPQEEARLKLQSVLRLLEGLRCKTYALPCWGYHFDFESRVFFYPRTEPNTIATAYAGAALLDAYAATGDEALLEKALGVGKFFLEHVPQTEDPPGAFFGYLVDDRSPIHNSNLHVCALLARLHGVAGDERMLEAAERGLSWSVARQREDGYWPYGERSNLGWIDNFHTGYVLDSLGECADAGLAGAEVALERGLRFYREALFLADGTPKYYSDSVYPLDMQCVAQAIQTLSLASKRKPSCLEQAWDVLDWACTRMRWANGMFAFQRRRFWTNRASHMRGVVAPMVLALTHQVAAAEELTSWSSSSGPATATGQSPEAAEA